MSEALDQPITTDPNSTQKTAAETQLAITAATLAGSVIQSVTSHPAVPAAQAPSLIATILNDLASAAPALFTLTRASAGTQTEVGLGLGVAEAIASAFLHPGS